MSTDAWIPSDAHGVLFISTWIYIKAVLYRINSCVLTNGQMESHLVRFSKYKFSWFMMTKPAKCQRKFRLGDKADLSLPMANMPLLIILWLGSSNSVRFLHVCDMKVTTCGHHHTFYSNVTQLIFNIDKWLPAIFLHRHLKRQPTATKRRMLCFIIWPICSRATRATTVQQ